MITDWNNARSSDLVPIPHRGLWGGAGGSKTTVAENTMAAFKAALGAGYRVLEIDAAMAGPACPDAYTEVFVGHYFSMLAAGGNVNDQPCQFTAQQLGQFSMRLRDGSANTLPSNALANIKDVVNWAKANQVLLMIDPKVPSLSPSSQEDDQYSRIIGRVLQVAREVDALENVAIKTTYNYNSSTAYFGPVDFESIFAGRFLWSPIVNKAACMKSKDQGPCTDSDKASEISTVTGAAAAWRQATNDSKQIITYEIQLYNSAHWASNPFTVQGVTYQGLIDFAARQTSNCPAKSWLCKRSAIWSIDPAGDKGTLGREYNWKFLGNTVGKGAWEDDQRGNPFVTLGYAASSNGTGYGSPLYAAVITDRPDMYSQFQISGPQPFSAVKAEEK
ncbi:hypothetical protein [Caulobacter sp. RHG1]|uniref:hypothetical protein n=1 Tax=Caulobacter sp. (strain RHG1) TaxID=2545762 RepID=UPI001552528D|nr:hypothetical protein [Caulobacter sp. RHG1]